MLWHFKLFSFPSREKGFLFALSIWKIPKTSQNVFVNLFQSLLQQFKCCVGKKKESKYLFSVKMMMSFSLQMQDYKNVMLPNTKVNIQRIIKMLFCQRLQHFPRKQSRDKEWMKMKHKKQSWPIKLQNVKHKRVNALKIQISHSIGN